MIRSIAVLMVSACLLAACSSAPRGDRAQGPGGEAGIISLRDLGYMTVGVDVSAPDEHGSVTVSGQMHVDYALVASPKYDVPLVLVHGGGGQSTDWYGTPDGRDGWRDYFLAAGFDVYAVDRPGFGRSSAAPDYEPLSGGSYGSVELAHSGFIASLAESDNWPGGAATPTNDAVIGWLATSSTTPYGGDALAAKKIAELLDDIGPAILISHSRGGPSAYRAAQLNPDKVVGVIAFEAHGSNPWDGEEIRRLFDWSPGLPSGFQTNTVDECSLPSSNAKHVLPGLSEVPVVFVGSGIYDDEKAIECYQTALSKAGVKVETYHMPDEGFPGVGHFMMAETNNAETAAFFIEIAARLAREAE